MPCSFWPAPPQRLIRISAQIYSTIADIERLAVALRDAIEHGCREDREMRGRSRAAR